ncbi:MAG: hypothetical protein IBJ09_02430 [Bacteroidia bacterium]|nr:hypothetical protein [Bacteroidia bacterium]
MISSAYTLIKRPQASPLSVQRKDVPLLQAKSTGLPDSLRSGLENMHAGVQPDTSKGVVQRQVDWAEGVRIKNRNLATPFLKQYDFGITPAIVNTTTIDGLSLVDTSRMLNGPEFHFEKTGKDEGALKVKEEPQNRVSYSMELPSAPPWQARVKPLHGAFGVKDNFPNVEKALLSSKLDEIDLDAGGDPSSEAFADLVEVHEDHHVEDLKKLRDNILVPWDTRIRKFKEADRSIHAATSKEAETEFYHQIGSTPAEIGQHFFERLRHKGNKFHKTEEGSTPRISFASFYNNTLYIAWKHPLG